MPFERTALPGLTVIGNIETDLEVLDLKSTTDWMACVDNSVQFPMGLPDDVFLHVRASRGSRLGPILTWNLQISERIKPTKPCTPVKPRLYNMKTLNGDIPPWHLRPRSIPIPESTAIVVNTIRACKSTIDVENWTAFFSQETQLTLPASSTHKLEIQADVHSTAFLRWAFKAIKSPSQIQLRVTYSEGYELEPRSYPFFRSKADRLDSTVGHIIGPYDEVTLDVPDASRVLYEPFWFRTFRLMRIEMTIGPQPVELVSFDATQVNYPMAVKASWKQPGDAQSKNIWDVSIRTMRNCMFDGYSDCPFYEQLQ
jgi:hypothetical protein